MNHQKGFSLIVIFLISTVVIVVLLSMSTMVFNKVKTIGNIENSNIAFQNANAGIEKVLYYKKNQNGICNICSICPIGDQNPIQNCNNCTATDLATNGCNQCTNCQVVFDTVMPSDGGSYAVLATVSPDPFDASKIVSDIKSEGTYRDQKRQAEVVIKDTAPSLCCPSSGSHCPDGGPVGGHYCGTNPGTQNKVYQNYIVNTCNNACAPSATCDASTVPQMQQDCTPTNQTCIKGFCLP